MIEFTHCWLDIGEDLFTLSCTSKDFCGVLCFECDAPNQDYRCSLYRCGVSLWEKNITLTVYNAETPAVTLEYYHDALKALISACLPDLLLAGYLISGSYKYNKTNFPVNSIEFIEAINLPLGFFD